MSHRLRLIALALFTVGPVAAAQERSFDVVVVRGRVVDPESGLDAVRSIGIRRGRIAAISAGPLPGQTVIDARGLVVAPGFIDLHAHGQDDENYRVFALDGVTTALELELGTANVDPWYSARVGKALINHGVSVGHIKTRMAVMGDPGIFLPTGVGGRDPATTEQIAEMKRRIRAELAKGALGVGFGLQYTPGASKHEVLEMFRAAADFKAPAFVHTRSWGTTDPGGSVESYMEVIAASAITGAPLHIVQLNSTSLAQTPLTLELVGEAREHGMDVTAEAYPYSAGMTEISSPLLDRFDDAPDSMYARLQLVSTGERLTRETFHRNRKPGVMIILHLNTPEMEAMAIRSPLTAIASDGLLEKGKGHPRTAGTSARVLGYYVRETKQLTLIDAVRKLALLPAHRLERLAPAFRAKGRIKVGADADLAIFDPATVIDKATYSAPNVASEGFRYVLVNGVPVVSGGQVRDGVFPGKPARAPTH